MKKKKKGKQRSEDQSIKSTEIGLIWFYLESTAAMP